MSATPRRGERAAESRLSRLLVILPWLMERREVPLAEVAATFRMTPEEVAAELELAAMCGVPPFVDELIDVFIDDETVFVGVPRLFTRPLRLTAPEGFALVAAGRAAMQLPGADPTSALGRGLAKLAAALGEEADDAGLVVDLAATPIVDEFVAAAKRVERVRMRYWTASRDETSERQLTPRRVLPRAGRLVRRRRRPSIGRIPHVPDRPSRVGRAHRPDSTTRSIPAATQTFPTHRWPGRWTGHSRGSPFASSRPARWVVDEYPVDAVTEQDDGVVEARFAVVSERWLERLLLRAGTDAEVIEPAKWRDHGRRVAARLLKRYE